MAIEGAGRLPKQKVEHKRGLNKSRAWKKTCQLDRQPPKKKNQEKQKMWPNSRRPKFSLGIVGGKHLEEDEIGGLCLKNGPGLYGRAGENKRGKKRDPLRRTKYKLNPSRGERFWFRREKTGKSNSLLETRKRVAERMRGCSTWNFKTLLSDSFCATLRRIGGGEGIHQERNSIAEAQV